MNYVRLDDLFPKARQNQTKLNDIRSDDMKIKKFLYIIKCIFVELFKFGLVFSSVLIITIIFVNFNIFNQTIREKFFSSQTYATDISPVTASVSNLSKNINLKNITKKNIYQETIQNSNDISYNSSSFINALDEKLSKIGTANTSKIYDKPLKTYLKNKINSYEFNFNILPPDNRVIINAIGVEAPIVDVTHFSSEKIEKADFDKELFKGVVKYPFTPTPIENGNILIFGHTSYYWWKNNPYGEIFAKIVKLENGDNIDLMWNSKVYTYKVEKKIVLTPKQVGNEYKKYSDGRYLTLMGCYPIGTDAERILVIAKQIEK